MVAIIKELSIALLLTQKLQAIKANKQITTAKKKNKTLKKTKESCPFHSQSSGNAERTHCILKLKLAILLDGPRDCHTE